VNVLDAYVEIALAAGDVPAARAAAEELAQITGRFDSQLLNAVAVSANGSVHLAEEDAQGALAALRQAFVIWREIDAPYETARVQVLVALACRQLGDHATAEMELSAARDAFRNLEAAPDLARVESLLRKPESKSASPLTDRELQVLRLVASGSTNRDIARKLGISEKTVARHLSNIFTKLDLPSRAAATAYAYQNGLIPSAST
jgi:DNA-binding NarL/FixJ family response regulator